MEPMCLSNSPKSPSSPGTNPNFLPAFLMGQATSPKQSSSSPGHNKSISFKGTPNPEPKNLRQKLFNQTMSSVNETHFTTFDNVNIDKGGPPKQGLFDTLNINKPTTPINNGMNAISPIYNSTWQNQVEQPSFDINESLSKINDSLNQSQNFGNNSVVRTNQQTSFNNISQQERQGFYWVTVFGFPPSAASLVLAQFSNFGTIVEKEFPTQGNWVNIKYSSTYEAAKALSMHGKLISNCIMVAVMPFNKQENKENVDGGNFMSPGRARSLRHTFVLPQISNEVVQPQNVPQKSTGIVSKAMEYIFGW